MEKFTSSVDDLTRTLFAIGVSAIETAVVIGFKRPYTDPIAYE